MRKQRKQISGIQQINTDGREVSRKHTILWNDTACRKRDKFSNNATFEYHTDHSKLDREFGISTFEYKISKEYYKFKREVYKINKGD